MDVSELFVRKSIHLLTEEYLSKIEASVDGLGDSNLWWRPNEASNSAGNLILHLCGNVTQWIIGGVGRRPYDRRRQEEFDRRDPLPRQELIARLRGVVSEAVTIVERLGSADLVERRKIQGYDVSVLEAVYHVVEHFGMHTGQIIWIAKLHRGEDLQLWKPPEQPDHKMI
jgi:hypothetical protein